MRIILIYQIDESKLSKKAKVLKETVCIKCEKNKAKINEQR